MLDLGLQGAWRGRARRSGSVTAEAGSSNVGTAAYGSGLTSRAPRSESSVIDACALPGVEERVERVPGLAAAVEAAPQPAQLPDQLVAGVDRHEIGLGLSCCRDPDQQCLDVGLERAEHRVGRRRGRSQASSGSSDSVAPAGLG